MSVRLVVDNPDVVRAPSPLSRADLSKRRLEAEYRRGFRYTATTELPSGGTVNLILWPHGGLWRCMHRLEIGAAASVSSDAGLYPTRLAGFDHGVACLRRAAFVLARSAPTDAIAIVRWLDSIEVPK